MPAGRATLLRLVRALPEPPPATPQVLGDDFALRRGKLYATLFADMTTRRPVDVVAGRNAEVVKNWPAARPGVRVICRDRTTAYADGARTGAPTAVQVADRWHLWHNLTEATAKCVVQHQACLRDPAAWAAFEPAAEAPTGLITRIRERYAAVHELTDAGVGYRPAARQLGLALGTVKRYGHAASVEELLDSAARPSNLDAYKAYLHQRASEGQIRPFLLFEEIRAMGYDGSKTNVRDYLRRYEKWAHAASGAPPPLPDQETTTSAVSRECCHGARQHSPVTVCRLVAGVDGLR